MHRGFRSATWQIPCHTHPYAMAARNDDAVYGFWMDLEQDVDHQSLVASWQRGLKIKTWLSII